MRKSTELLFDFLKIVGSSPKPSSDRPVYQILRIIEMLMDLKGVANNSKSIVLKELLRRLILLV